MNHSLLISPFLPGASQCQIKLYEIELRAYQLKISMGVYLTYTNDWVSFWSDFFQVNG